jgi:DNA replication protein DnaC
MGMKSSDKVLSIGDVINKMTEEWRVVNTTTETRVCDKHGEYSVNVLHYANGEIGISNECPKCEQERAKEKVRKESVKFWSDIGIGERYWDEDFNTFNAYTPELKHHLAVCQRFAENPTGALGMLGSHGNGKNHLVSSILKRTGGLKLTMFRLGLMVKRTYNGKSSEFDELDKFARLSGVLVIDEIGRSSGSDWELNILSDIVNTRYEDKRPYILMSNLHANAECEKGGCPDCFETFVGSDIISRMYQEGEILVFHGADYRIERRIR